MRFFIFSIFFLMLSGCASNSLKVAVSITSEPAGAVVDLNGLHIGTTPFRTYLQLEKKWVGLANSHSGYGYPDQKFEFVAYPPADAKGSFQKKNIDAQSLEGGAKIHFQFGSVTNVAPLEIDVNVKRNR